MIKTNIHSGWRMHKVGDAEFLPASVPGSVYNDLLAAGKMEDPFWRDNEMKALAVMDDDFEYVTEFDVDKETLKCDAVILRFEGVDTVADITLNGEILGSVKNMHRTYEFEVKDLLKAEGNELKVYFHSPNKYIAEHYEIDKCDGAPECTTGFPSLRKAHCMFGWDWGPRLPDAGLWRPVSLLGIEKMGIDIVRVFQSGLDRTSGNFVELDTLDIISFLLDDFGDVPGDGFTFAVRVGREEDGLSFGRRFLQILHDFFFALDDLIARGEVVFFVHGDLTGRQVTDVAHAGLHHILAAQEFFDGLHLGR